jgi:hypothetical protein
MRKLLNAVLQLPWWQKIVVGAMVALILVTWLAVCLILTGYIGS